MRVLDLACGGGQLTQRLHAKGHSAGDSRPAWTVEGADMSEVALEQARAQTGRTDAWHRIDLLRDELPEGYDAIIATLFFHHLTRDQAVDLLRRCASAVPRVLVHDLTRSRLALAATTLATRLVTRSPTVHVDGPRSVRAAWTSHEARQLFTDAGLANVKISRVVPFRFQAVWERS